MVMGLPVWFTTTVLELATVTTDMGSFYRPGRSIDSMSLVSVSQSWSFPTTRIAISLLYPETKGYTLETIHQTFGEDIQDDGGEEKALSPRVGWVSLSKRNTDCAHCESGTST